MFFIQIRSHDQLLDKVERRIFSTHPRFKIDRKVFIRFESNWATDLIPMSLMLMLPSEMDSVLLQSSKQRNLLEYFADSFFEEGTGQGTTSSLSGDTAVANHSPGGGGVEGVTITQPPHPLI